ncbi:MAG: TonB-dependent receptor [Bacteroidota bacterium]
MQRKLFCLLLISALLPALTFAAGKIRGKVTDAGTGEPLVGANVVVVGTSMGAATNTVGEYTILNVPAGDYTLRTSYVGYQPITISNIRVNNELTTEANFQLPAEGVTVATVEITAERPLINKSATNAVRIIDAEFFSKFPARGTNAAIAIQPGVVSQGGNLYVRGGRPDEIGYRVEGVNATDIVYGGSALYTSAEAVEQIQVQAGGYSAEFGNANAGIVQSQMRLGNPERWKASLLAETDRYTGQNKKALGGFSYGYTDFTATLGGPLLGKLRVFGSIQNTFFRDPAAAVRGPYELKNFVTDGAITPAHATARPDTIPLLSQGGNSIGGMNNRWAFAGTAQLDLGKLQLRGSGSYSYTNRRASTVFQEVLNTSRLPLSIDRNGFANLKLSYIFSPTTFLEVNGNFFAASTRTMDPDFQEDLFLYGDSLANAKLGYRMYRESQNFARYTFFNGAIITSLSQPGRQIAGYGKNKTTSIGGRADFTTQMKIHELKVGGEFTRYTIRRYNPAGVINWAAIGKQATSTAELENLLNKSSGIGSDIIGYDILGNQLDGDVIKNNAMLYLGPRHPVFAAIYAQDKIELSDIIMNLGLRWDFIDPNSVDTPDPGNLTFNADDYILASYFQNTKKTSQISPRIGFSFPVTDRTVFHAQYGKFIQQSRLNDSYRGAANMSGNIKGGLWVAAPNGWGLLPERTTQYELGFSQVVSDNASFDVTAFYKDIRDQIQFIMVPPTGGQAPIYTQVANVDFSTSKGIEMKFTLRRTERFSVQMNYTFMDARSTATDPTSSNGIWQLGLGPESLPKYVMPTNFDYRHSGSILADYRFGVNDGGPILSQLGLNLLFQFNSGHAFTRLHTDSRGPKPGDARFRDPLEPPGSSTTPWFFQLDGRIDKTVRFGPLDVNFYVYVINILGTDNPVDVFPRTGDTEDDGWLSSAAGQTDVATLGPRFVEMYKALYLGENSGNFGPPRQIRFGLRLEY